MRRREALPGAAALIDFVKRRNRNKGAERGNDNQLAHPDR
jgi:hypothetical protein